MLAAGAIDEAEEAESSLLRLRETANLRWGRHDEHRPSCFNDGG